MLQCASFVNRTVVLVLVIGVTVLVDPLKIVSLLPFLHFFMLIIVLLGVCSVPVTSTAVSSDQQIGKNARNGTEWIYVEFFDCPSILEVNVSAIRGALARWINEECATALQCNLDGTLTANNIFVGSISCGTPNNFITFLVLNNATDDVSLEENRLDLNIVGKVIQSREHLLSVLLHSDLKIVTVRIFYEDEKQNIVNNGNRLCNSFYCYLVTLLFPTFVVALLIYFIQRSAIKRKSASPHHSLLALQTLSN